MAGGKVTEKFYTRHSCSHGTRVLGHEIAPEFLPIRHRCPEFSLCSTIINARSDKTVPGMRLSLKRLGLRRKESSVLGRSCRLLEAN